MEGQVEEPIQVVVLRLLVKSPRRLHRMRTPERAARELTRQWEVRVWDMASSALVTAFQNCRGLLSRMAYCQGKVVEREKKE